MVSPSSRKRRRVAKLTFESLEPRVVLDGQLVALFAAGSIAPAIPDSGLAAASEVAATESQFVRFASADELRQFLVQDADKRYADLFGREAWRWWYPMLTVGDVNWGFGDAVDSSVSVEARADNDYSTTNVQVAGVDEGDLIKTDGRCLYIGRGSEVTIVDVQSAAQMRILSRLSSEGTMSALYLSDDRLTVISQYYTGLVDPMLSRHAAAVVCTRMGDTQPVPP